MTAPVRERVDDCDIGLFAIPTQTTEAGRRSLLALQKAAIERLGSYRYLEIGSHLGGSLLPHAMDDRCSGIISIDSRPVRQPDERGPSFSYEDNHTERMMGNLTRVPEANLDKIRTYEHDSRELDPSALGHTSDLAFVDGEHTNEAVLSDAEFSLRALAGQGTIVFHDLNVVFGGLRRFLERLEYNGLAFRTYVLPDCLFCIDIGKTGLADTEALRPQLARSGQAALYCLAMNDWYRVAVVRSQTETPGPSKNPQQADPPQPAGSAPDRSRGASRGRHRLRRRRGRRDPPRSEYVPSQPRSCPA